MQKLKKFFDFIFLYLLVFFISLAWINVHIKKLKKTFLLAILISGIIFAVIYFFIALTQKRKKQKNDAEKLKQTTKTTLEFITFKKQKQIEKSLENVLQTKNVFCHFGEFGKTQLTDCIKSSNQREKICILTTNCTFDAKILAKNFKNQKIEIFDFEQTYQILKNNGLLPARQIEIKEQKVNFKMFFAFLLQKNNAKKFFYLSLFLAFSILFTPYKIYYAIFASIFAFMSFICKFKDDFKIQKIS